MKTVEVHRAVGIGPQEINPVRIVLGEPMPPKAGDDWIEKSTKSFDEDADKIVDALAESLPGGTLDAVLRKLLERRASLLVVPMFDEKPNQQGEPKR